LEVKKDILWRVYLVYVFMCLFGLAILIQVFRLQFIQGAYWRSKADSLTTDVKNIEAARGNIYAEDGSLLATSIPIYEVRMDAQAELVTRELFNSNVDSLAISLSSLFKDKSTKEYRRDLITARKEKDRYFLIQRNVSYQDLKVLRRMPIFRMGKYKGGLIIIQHNTRKKPFEMLASRTIGFARDVKPVGLESSFNEYLEGIGGKRLMQKISGNVWIPINDDSSIEPKDGSDLITTIDINIQDVAENALLKQLSAHNAAKGCAILMEVATGKIKAIVNLSKDATGTYNENYNLVIGESTEPGSTFKLASMIAAMDEGYVNLNDSIDLEDGSHRYYDRVMHDSHAPKKRVVSVMQAFEESSNVGISKLITKYYQKKPQAFVDKLNAMSLNKKLGLQLDGEASPRIKNTKSKDWYGTSLPWMSIGYEVQFTPLQMLNLYNTIANNGKMIKPMFVKEIRQRGQLVESFNTEVINPAICSEETVKKAQKLLEGVVERGTGKTLQNPNFKIAGKTGTAQIAKAGGYKSGAKDSTTFNGVSYQASFVGYFPADNPKYSCMVVVYAPSNNAYYAAEVAGPVFKEIADKVYASSLDMHKELEIEYTDKTDAVPYAYTGYKDDIKTIFSQFEFPQPKVEETAKWVSVLKQDSTITLKTRRTGKGLVPNVMGMGLKDAIYILESAGLHVKIVGRGYVSRQSLEVGTRVSKGSEITIELI
jgi:cell division protein FtsI (penicillin-binding protein 3)